MRRIGSLVPLVAWASLTLSAIGCGAGPVVVEASPRDIGGPWQAEPYAIDPAIVSAAVAACQANEQKLGGSLGPLALVDARGGDAVQLAFTSAGGITTCLAHRADGAFVVDGGSGGSGTGTFAAPPKFAIVNGIASFSSSGPAGSSVAVVSGTAGAGVAAVDVFLSSGRRIRATTANGWFAAWWPGGEIDLRIQAVGPDGRVLGEPHE